MSKKCWNCKGSGLLWPNSTQKGQRQRQVFYSYPCDVCKGKGVLRGKVLAENKKRGKIKV